MKTKATKPTAAHQNFRNDAVELLRKHGAHLHSDEMLALAAHLCGQVMAMQDQHKMTKEMAIQLVIDNIECGNKEVIASLDKTEGSA